MNTYMVEYIDCNELFGNYYLEVEAVDREAAWSIAEGELCQAGTVSDIEIINVEETG